MGEKFRGVQKREGGGKEGEDGYLKGSRAFAQLIGFYLFQNCMHRESKVQTRYIHR